MTTVRMLQQMSGTRNGQPWPERGETMEVSAEEAATLGLGQTPIAVIVEEERAVAPDPEQPEEHSAPAEAPVTTRKATTRQARK